MMIREAHTTDAASIARVYVDGWRTTYPGIVDDAYLNTMSYEKQQQRWLDILQAKDGCIFVIEEASGEIVAFIWGGDERSGDPIYRGELHAIYVRKSHQHQGLGRLLTETLVRRLLQQGISSMLVWVLAANASRNFYEALGAKPVRTAPFMIGDRAYDDAAYGWRDIRTLLPD